MHIQPPSGNSGVFAVKLHLILKYLLKPKLEFITCDFNVNFFIVSSSAQQLTYFLQSYNLFHITEFITWMTKDSSSATDIILITAESNHSRYFDYWAL